MGRKKRVYVAALATETNTFSPLPTNLASFHQGLFAPPGAHPPYPTLCSAPFVAARAYCARHDDWQLVEGSAYWAEPGGLIERKTYEQLRDSLLAEVEDHLPLDGILLGLHGAMTAEGYADCEGDLLARLRARVGPTCPLMTEFDLHLHVTRAKLDNTDLLVSFKEFPHTDFLERAEALVHLATRLLKKEIRPVHSVFDCRMVEIMPTSHEPMRGFIQKVKRLEAARNDVLCVSVGHGFMAGDVPEMGCKIVVMTDNNPAEGEALAQELGQELFALRGHLMMPTYSIEEGLARAQRKRGAPIVLADIWDNPGGGVPGDATYVLHALLERGEREVALASIWDPQAVQQCLAAGEGRTLWLRFGGHSCDRVGAPVEAQIKIKKIQPKAWQSFGASRVSLGTAVVLECAGLEVVLNSARTQIYSPDAFTNLGIDLTTKRILVVKSTNHFYAAFAKLSPHIYHISAPGCYPSDPKNTAYARVRRPIWPCDDLSWPAVLAHQKDF